MARCGTPRSLRRNSSSRRSAARTSLSGAKPMTWKALWNSPGGPPVLQLSTKKGVGMRTITRAKFLLGQVVATPGAVEAMAESGQTPAFFLDQHASGNWGVVDEEDGRLNDEALKDGSRILS